MMVDSDVKVLWLRHTHTHTHTHTPHILKHIGVTCVCGVCDEKRITLSTAKRRVSVSPLSDNLESEEALSLTPSLSLSHTQTHSPLSFCVLFGLLVYHSIPSPSRTVPQLRNATDDPIWQYRAGRAHRHRGVAMSLRVLDQTNADATSARLRQSAASPTSPHTHPNTTDP